jgi:hypothetical protein
MQRFALGSLVGKIRSVWGTVLDGRHSGENFVCISQHHSKAFVALRRIFYIRGFKAKLMGSPLGSQVSIEIAVV